jgi:hypothetical protein
VIGQAFRFAAADGDDEDVLIAVILSAVGDPLTVGGEFGVALFAVVRGQAARQTAG